jgi:hypothetical protein
MLFYALNISFFFRGRVVWSQEHQFVWQSDLHTQGKWVRSNLPFTYFGFFRFEQENDDADLPNIFFSKNKNRKRKAMMIFPKSMNFFDC